MAGPAWVDGLFAALSVLIALYSASRLVIARRSGDSARFSGEVTHLLMAGGMAAMFVPSLDPLPSAVWAGVFVLNGAWLIAALPRAATDGGLLGSDQRHRVHLVISSVAMVYMFATMGTPAPIQTALALPASGTGVLAHVHGAGGLSLAPLTIAFAAYFLIHAVWSGLPVVRAGAVSPHAAGGSVVAAPRLLFAPRLAGACHVVMGLGMSYMFTTMLG